MISPLSTGVRIEAVGGMGMEVVSIEAVVDRVIEIVIDECQLKRGKRKKQYQKSRFF